MKITLRAARVNTGLAVEEAAERVERNWKTLQKYERDSSKIPFELLKGLCELYRVDMKDIHIGPEKEHTDQWEGVKTSE